MKKLWGKIGLGLMLSFFVLTSSCLYTRIDEQMIKHRGYLPSKPKEYFEPVKYLTVNAIDYAYIEKGQGPTIILLHGGVINYDIMKSFAYDPAWDVFSLLTLTYIWPARAQSLLHFGAVSTIDTWQYNFNYLAKSFNVIALDLPGFGNSTKPDIRYTIPEMTNLLDQFILAKGLKNVTIVGHDFSGLLAMDYALTYPDKIAGLVLISPYGSESPSMLWPNYLFWHYPRWCARHMYKDKAARVDLFRRTLKPYGKKTYQKLFYRGDNKYYDITSDREQAQRLMYNDSPQARQWLDQVIKFKFDSDWMKTKEFTNELYATHMSLTDTRRKDVWGIWTMKDDNRTDWILRMAKIKAPTMIIRGAFDPVLKAEDATYMNKVMPNSALSTFGKSAHYPMVEESDRFNKELDVFIGGVYASAARK